MYLKKNFLILTILSIFFLTQSYASQNVAYIDVDRLIKESTVGKKILIDLDLSKKKNLETLKKDKNELLKKENDLKKKRNLISKEALEIKLKDLEKEVKLYNQNLSQINNEFDINKNKVLKNFFLKINPIIQEFMSENTIDILVEKKYIFIGQSKLDITDQILKLIDKNIKIE